MSLEWLERNQLVEQHLGLVRPVARRIMLTLPRCVELDDLAQEGAIGLMAAASKHNPVKNPDFKAYAKQQIRWSILDSLRELDWAPRDGRNLRNRIEKATNDLTAALQRNPTEEEVADKLGFTLKQWRRKQLDLLVVGPVPMEWPDGGPDDEWDGTERQVPADPSTQPDWMVEQAETQRHLHEAMGKLRPRYQTALREHYWNEKTTEEVGKLIGISRTRAANIIAAARKRLLRLLVERGVL